MAILSLAMLRSFASLSRVSSSYFIIIPKKSHIDAFVLGLVIYGVYEGTNYAILKKWPLKIVIMDTLWGGILFALTSFFVNSLNIH